MVFARSLMMVLVGCWVSVADAAPLDRLKAFLNDTRTGRATFSQSVVAKSGSKTQEATGTMVFARPGKFRWRYEKPYEQLIVGDGEKLWVYDPELQQVTVKKIAAALGASPAALLSGNNAIEQYYDLRNGAVEDGLEWVEAKPKTAESGFERIRMAFQSNDLRTMVLYDNFGQTTTLMFGKFERNPSLSAKLFTFTPPAGADVIGE